MSASKVAKTAIIRNCDLGRLKPRFVGDFTIIEGNVTIEEGTWIGHFCLISALNTSISIGKNCEISSGVHILDHTTHERVWGKPKIVGPVFIGDYVHVGEHATILANSTIKPHTVVGSGSVVFNTLKHPLPDWCFTAGIPCKVLEIKHEEKKDWEKKES